jgi:hypothetical protein
MEAPNIRYRRLTRPEGSEAGHSAKETTMNFGYSGILGIVILAGDVWAIINIFQSSVANEKKLIWTLAVVLLPLLGLILWFFMGPRGRAG